MMTHLLSDTVTVEVQNNKTFVNEMRMREENNDLVIFVMIPLTEESSDQRSTKKEKIKRGKMRSLTETFVQLDPWNRGREEPDCGPLPVQL